jgi:hypothetical protein
MQSKVKELMRSLSNFVMARVVRRDHPDGDSVFRNVKAKGKAAWIAAGPWGALAMTNLKVSA